MPFSQRAFELHVIISVCFFFLSELVGEDGKKDASRKGIYTFT